MYFPSGKDLEKLFMLVGYSLLTSKLVWSQLNFRVILIGSEAPEQQNRKQELL